MNIFTDTFNQCLNTCAPLVPKVVRRPFAPWINDNIKATMNHRNGIQRDLKEDKLNGTLQEKYKHLKIYVKNMIRTAKRTHYNEEFTSKRGDIAATWRV